MQYYQHHIGDFLKDTSRMSDSQSMAYLRMLWKYYDDERPLQGTPEELAFDFGASIEDMKNILRKFFTESAEGWRNKRADIEIAAFYAKSEAAKESAKKRWDRGKHANASKNDANALRTHTERTPNAMPTQCEGNATHNPLPITQEEILKTPPTPSRGRRGGSEIDPAIAEVCDAWNATADSAGLQGVRMPLSTKRRGQLVARLRDRDWAEHWPEALSRIALSDFCRGLTGNRGWRADFDFFVKPDTVTKALEGTYDNRTAGSKPILGKPDLRDAIEANASEWLGDYAEPASISEGPDGPTGDGR